MKVWINNQFLTRKHASIAYLYNKSASSWENSKLMFKIIFLLEIQNLVTFWLMKLMIVASMPAKVDFGFYEIKFARGKQEMKFIVFSLLMKDLCYFSVFMRIFLPWVTAVEFCSEMSFTDEIILQAVQWTCFMHGTLSSEPVCLITN